LADDSLELDQIDEFFGNGYPNLPIGIKKLAESTAHLQSLHYMGRIVPPEAPRITGTTVATTAPAARRLVPDQRGKISFEILGQRGNSFSRSTLRRGPAFTSYDGRAYFRHVTEPNTTRLAAESSPPHPANLIRSACVI
jgi:hypothetical protein